MMSRIHPSSENKNRSYCLPCDNHHHHDVVENQGPIPVSISSSSPKQANLTVWKRSSMTFQGTDGFTVYDHHGSLAFRVDNYSRNTHIISSLSCSSRAAAGGGGGGAALVLMDGSGKPLMTLKPQIFSIQNQWNGCIYKEDDNGWLKSDRRIFTMRRPLLVFGRTQKQQAQCEAEVFITGTTNEHQNHHQTGPEVGDGAKKLPRKPDFRIEGSFWNRNCKIMCTVSGEVAAKIMRKRTAAAVMMGGSNSSSSSKNTSTITLSEEVFSLVVEPGFDPQLIMAFVVILDRICFKPFLPHIMC